MQKIGVVTSWLGGGFLEVWWNEATGKVWIYALGMTEQQKNVAPTWHCEDDGLIVKTIGRHIGALCETEVILTNLMIFDESGRHGKKAPVQLLTDIYDCEWSDFACEHQVIHMQAHPPMSGSPDRYQRLAFALWNEDMHGGISLHWEKIQQHAEELREQDIERHPPRQARRVAPRAAIEAQPALAPNPEPVVITTFEAEARSPENHSRFFGSILRAIAAAEAAHAAEDSDSDIDDSLEPVNGRPYYLPCPCRNKLTCDH